MKAHVLADLHGFLPATVPPGDLLVLAGDIVPLTRQFDAIASSYWLDTTFREWLLALKRPVVATWGNHDWIGQRRPEWVPKLPWTLLVDQAADLDIDGQTVKCYGSPWQPTFLDWAFNLDEDQLMEKWRNIPGGLDILVLHGPPRGILDLTADGTHAGSPSLRWCIAIAKPKVTVFGHIHHSYGEAARDGMRFFNASYVNEQYRPGFHKIQSFEL